MQDFWWIGVWLLKLKETKMEHSLDMKSLNRLENGKELRVKTREAVASGSLHSSICPVSQGWNQETDM